VDGWAGEQKVYFVGPEEQLSGLRGPFAEGTFKIVARIKLPEAPTQDRPFGGPGGMPGGPGGLPGPPGGTPGGPDGMMPPGFVPGEAGGGRPETGGPADRPAFRDRAASNRRGNRASRREVGGMRIRGRQYGDEIVIAEWIGRPPSRAATGSGSRDDHGPPDFFAPPGGPRGGPPGGS
jgi:hypothetical protein